ncbi:GntR family transcriptional regulator [Agreia sp.]|uniref:GntR family transcriptional regulator n=1 Tax=Agreia sp. TaxID=1872416 RepID=UPI0035BC92B9
MTAEIRRAVLTGALPPGEQFSIRELTRQLGVSHIPIREALRRLESQGLIILKQAQSATVASLTTDDMESIYRLRLTIEPQLAADSVAVQTPEGFARLKEWLELSRDDDPEVAWKGHHDFHEGLVLPAASDWDLRILNLLWTAAERYTHLVFDPTPIDEAERRRRYDSHALLLQSALDGDATRMRDLLIQHFTFNEDEIRLRIDALARIRPASSAGPR